jgi:hypothetical protein
MQRRLGFFTSPVEKSLNPMAAIGIDRRRRVGPRCSGGDQALPLYCPLRELVDDFDAVHPAGQLSEHMKK